ncbi:CKLF-like MARVEL transmembrane domain-containing protein 7 isoform X1 [Arapaima gigas]
MPESANPSARPDSDGPSRSTLLYDPRFLRSAPAVLTFAELVFGLLVWMMVTGTEYFHVPAFGWVMFVAITYWVLTVIFFIVYLTKANARIPRIPWIPVVVLFIAFLCVRCSSIWTDYSAYHFFEVVTIWFHIAFLIFLFLHVFQLQSKMSCINWTMTEFLHCILAAFLIFIASIVAAVKSYGLPSLVAGSVFGFIATGLLVIRIWFSYKITNGQPSTSVPV